MRALPAVAALLLLASAPVYAQQSDPRQSTAPVSGDQPRPLDSKQIEPESENHNALKPRPQITDPKDAPPATTGSGAPTAPGTGQPGSPGKDWPKPPDQPKQN